MLLPGGFNRPQTHWIIPYVVLGGFFIVSSAIGLGPYSGFNDPPRFGDFEAQRHWLEITSKLPVSQWYFTDPEWWGLDYPPLTALHSWALGKLGDCLDHSWFALDTSHGLETDGLKSFMRFTVLLSQLVLYLPFVYYYAKSRAASLNLGYAKWHDRLFVFLLTPSLIIIDNGHFQYNSVMLGLFIGALAALHDDKFVTASIWFVCALFFKQMALFWSPVVFFYILGQCSFDRIGFFRLVHVGAAVIGTALVLLTPWLATLHPQQQLLQIVHRVFPFGRGLWEDKVANFWCATNTFVKYRQLFDADQLRRFALIATLVAMAPSCVAAYFCRSRVKLTIAFSCCAWSFYLFGFQVHEKSVLVPLIPTTLLIFECNPEWTAMIQWLNNIAYYSMFPLLRREHLVIQFFAVAILWNSKPRFPAYWLNQLVVAGSYAAIFVLSLSEGLDLVPLAARYTDLYVVANLTLSFACFVYGFLWLHRQLYSLS